MTRGGPAAGPGSTAAAGNRYELEDPLEEEAELDEPRRRDRAWLPVPPEPDFEVRAERLRLAAFVPRELDEPLRAEEALRVEALRVVPLRPEEALRVDPLRPEEALRVLPLRLEELRPEDPFAPEAPSFAPFTAPRAAATATSPAFIRPARP